MRYVWKMQTLIKLKYPWNLSIFSSGEHWIFASPVLHFVNWSSRKDRTESFYVFMQAETHTKRSQRVFAYVHACDFLYVTACIKACTLVWSAASLRRRDTTGPLQQLCHIQMHLRVWVVILVLVLNHPKKFKNNKFISSEAKINSPYNLGLC